MDRGAWVPVCALRGSCKPRFLRHQEKCLMWRFLHSWCIKRSNLLQIYLSQRYVRKNMAYSQSNNVWTFAIRELLGLENAAGLCILCLACCIWTVIWITGHSDFRVHLPPIKCFISAYLGVSKFHFERPNVSNLQRCRSNFKHDWNNLWTIWLSSDNDVALGGELLM